MEYTDFVPELAAVNVCPPVELPYMPNAPLALVYPLSVDWVAHEAAPNPIISMPNERTGRRRRMMNSSGIIPLSPYN
jgi:hypothetical protein